ncbi:MAG: restriction endonuclease [Dehalococcoidia bacterium]
MLPTLRELGDGAERPSKDIRAAISAALGLSHDDLAEMLPSGKQTRFTNRSAWALVYLRQAGLLQSPRRGHYQITDRGRETLASGVSRIDMNYLERFPEYREFRDRPGTGGAESDTGLPSGASGAVDSPAGVLTPDEQIRAGYKRHRAGLASQLLERVKQAPPRFFESLVIDLLVAMGYGGTEADAARVVGRSGDGGIDGIIKEDRLGLESIYVQAKRWEGSVGRPEIQRFAGALQGQRARKGVFITTSTFTREAMEYAADVHTTIVLIDGAQLAQLMIDFGVGVAEVEVIRLKRIDEDYFVEE